MKVEQISIFLENKPGALESVTRLLKDANINIRTLSLADTSDFGILRLIVNDVNTTLKVLNENGLRVSRTTVVAVEVPDRPGGLHSILEVLAKNSINVEYLYAFVEKSGKKAVVVLRMDSISKGKTALKKAGISVLSPKEVYNL